jgi:hypothetical protein
MIDATIIYTITIEMDDHRGINYDLESIAIVAE